MAKKRTSKTASNGEGAERPDGGSPQEMYFLSLSLENLRCFTEKQTLDLSDGQGKPAQLTLLLGDNGTGKTTVLQALAFNWEKMRLAADVKARPAAAQWPSHASAWSDAIDIGPIRDGQGGWSLFLKYGWGTRFTDGGAPISSAEVETRQALAASRIPSGIATGYLRAPPFDKLPPCYGYGAARRVGRAEFLGTGGPLLATDTESLFSDGPELLDAEEWLLRLDYSSKASDDQPRQRARLEQVKALLLDILPDVSDFRFVVGTGVNPVSRVDCKTPYGWAPFRQLGYGYQMMITWTVDLANRMMERYPDSPNPLSEPAVVLVDEIDLHLHPKWQRQLIGHLTKNFPNTQFIATAHSPLVVQAAADANIAVLRREGDHVVIDNDTKAVRGWRLDQVVTSDLFGLPTARPPQFDELLKRRTEILSKGKLTREDKDELKRLEDEIGDLPFGETAQQAEDMRLIKETLESLKKDRTPKP